MKTFMMILSIAFAVLACEQAVAETSTAGSTSTWTVAPSLGLTSFQLKADSGDLDSKSGMSVGAQVYYNLGMENLDVESGLQYIQAGGKAGSWLAGVEVNLDYLAVPVGLRFKVMNYGADNKNFLYLRGGVAAAFLMSAKSKGTGFLTGAESDVKDNVNAFDLMAVAGIGGSYGMGGDQHVLYELNYMRGTQKVMKEGNSHSEGYALNLLYSIPM